MLLELVLPKQLVRSKEGTGILEKEQMQGHSAAEISKNGDCTEKEKLLVPSLG